MENIVLNITIGERDKSEAFLNFYRDSKVELSLGTFGKGTARRETLDVLGLGSSDKCVIFSLMTEAKSKVLLKEIETKMSLRTIGMGISFTVPLSSIDSYKNLKKLVDDFDINKESEGYAMDTENQLIVIIANRGYTDEVMNVAREAGAPGGTVVHARGTGSETAAKFFGTTIGAEKEMIFIVTKSEKCADIMKAIKEKAGAETPSEAVSFSLPVANAAGLLGL
jgi:nitrogen regulatory protein PII